MIRNRQREDAEVDEAKRKLVPRLVVAVLALVVGLTGAVSASPGSGASGVVLAQGRMPGRLKIKTREASDVVVQQVTLQPGGFTGWHTHPGVVLAVVNAGTLTRYLADCHLQDLQNRRCVHRDGRCSHGAQRGPVRTGRAVRHLYRPGWQPAADRGRPSPLRCIPWSGGLLRGTGVRLPERGPPRGGAEQERLPRGAAPNVRPGIAVWTPQHPLPEESYR